MSPRVRLLVAALALAGVHVALVNHFVPLRVIFSHARLQGDDYDLHAGQVMRVVEGLRDFGHSWVYDVKLVAGQPEGTIIDSGSKGWELYTFALTRLGVPEGVAFNSFVLLVMLAWPLLLFAGARGFELDASASLIAAALGSCLWFFDSFTHWLWFIGMVSYALATALSVLTLAFFFRFLERGRLGFALPGGLCLGLAHLIHPYAFFALAPPIAALYLRAFRRLPTRAHLALAGCAAFTLALNGYWLLNARAHWHYILNSAFYAQARLEYVLSDFLGILRNGGDTGVIGPHHGFRLLCLGFCCAQLWQWRRSAADPRVLPLALALGFSLMLAYAGGHIPLAAQIQPYRLLAPAGAFSVVPAAACLEGLFRARPFARAERGARVLLAVGAVLVAQHLCGQALYFLPRLIPETERFGDGSPSSLSKYGFLALHSGPSHVHYGVPHDDFVEIGVKEVMTWLEQHAAKGSRLLVEGNLLGERLGWKTDFEVMGGFVERNMAHAYANYFRQFDGHPLAEPELARYLQTFAIAWVVSLKEHPEFARAKATLELAAVIGGRRIYRTRLPIATMLEGGGRVYARTNRLEVRGSDANTPLLLSYHFHEALRCAPNCKLERAQNRFDRVGLIRIPSPHPRDLLVFNGYE